ncbi:MAG: LacI family transcriptional regulator [Gammaproteobacteria bacterium]|nr:LacI family transcriptional regulator [Gammaproteobacteria bacterium]MDH3414728.1 LacI family transcriptional regulator [Gammaproteobacteria bacterium]
MAKRNVNIKDVAAKAKVHPSTVSRVLNPETRSMVSGPVADRVTRIAAEMGYARSSLAYGLRTGRTHTIGVVIPDLTNPLFPPIIRQIERTLAEQGYIAILADSDNNQKNETAIVRSLMSRNVDGLILATAHRLDAVVSTIAEDRVPLVLVNRTIDTHSVTAVINDDEHGIELAVSHLVGLGHKSIAYLGGPQDTSTGHDRFLAFKQLMRAGTFKSHNDLILNCKAFTEAEGHRGFVSILEKRRQFTAVIAANDLLALGCYDAMAERGLSCPGDISVTGFNDMPFMNRLSPPLTSLRIPHDEIGSQAATLLLERIRNVESKVMTVNLLPELIVRASTAAPKSRE